MATSTALVVRRHTGIAVGTLPKRRNHPFTWKRGQIMKGELQNLKDMYFYTIHTHANVHGMGVTSSHRKSRRNTAKMSKSRRNAAFVSRVLDNFRRI